MVQHYIRLPDGCPESGMSYPYTYQLSPQTHRSQNRSHGAGQIPLWLPKQPLLSGEGDRESVLSNGTSIIGHLVLGCWDACDRQAYRRLSLHSWSPLPLQASLQGSDLADNSLW